MYLASEENIPMSSWSWLWKKRSNSIFPASQGHSKTEAWVQTGIPSSSQVTEEPLRGDAEPQSQATILSSIPLPGSATDYVDEMQIHPVHMVKIAAVNKDGDCGEILQGQSLLNKRPFGENKLTFVKYLNEKKSNKTAAQTVRPSSHRMPSHDNQQGGCQPIEEQPYIPYRLAKLHITKIVKDMLQMKLGYMQVIKELEYVGKERQEQAITALKNQYSSKLKNLRAQLETYQETVDRKSQYWQNRTKNLEEENRKLRQENEELLNQMALWKEKWDTEKAWLLKSTSQKIDHLYTQHALTAEELQRSRIKLENVQKIVDFQMDLPCDQRRAYIISDEITENRSVDKDANKAKPDAAAQVAGATETGQHPTSFVVETEKTQHCLPQKKLTLEVKSMLELLMGSLRKREVEINELLQSDLWCNT